MPDKVDSTPVEQWMARVIRARWADWKAAVRMPLLKLMAALWSAYGLVAFFRDEVAPADWQPYIRLVEWLPGLSLYTWSIVMVGIVLLATVEGVHGLSNQLRTEKVNTDERIAELERRLDSGLHVEGLYQILVFERESAKTRIQQGVYFLLPSLFVRSTRPTMVLFKLQFVLENGAELILEACSPEEIPEISEWKSDGKIRVGEQLPYRLDLQPEVGRTGYVVWQLSQPVMEGTGLTSSIGRTAKMTWYVEDFKTKQCHFFPVSHPTRHQPAASQPDVSASGSVDGSSGGTPHTDDKKSE